MAVEKILVVDDEPIIRKSFEELLRGKRYGVTSVATLHDAERVLKRDTFDVAFLDLRLPDGDGRDLLEPLRACPQRPLIVIMSGGGATETAMDCLRLGAFDYLIKPFSLNQIEVLVRKAESFRQVLQVNEYLEAQISDSGDLVGESPAMMSLRRLLRKVAPTEAAVLIEGETGTGKELVAHQIYHESARAAAPYLKVDCAAAPEDRLESELFGHEKGTFAGATERRDGCFQLAHGGTLLLDEISVIPPRLQAKLLRALQEREFERVGGTKSLKVDVRVLATTNRDLRQAVATGEFREDLYHRLNVFPVAVPPLRERAADLPLLAETFLRRAGRKHGTRILGLAAEALEPLLAYSWPGNVRELQHTMERAVILTERDTWVQPAALGLPQVASESAPDLPPGKFCPLHELEKRHILSALAHTGGNRTQAAELLRISIRTLRNKLNEYALEPVSAP